MCHNAQRSACFVDTVNLNSKSFTSKVSDALDSGPNELAGKAYPGRKLIPNWADDQHQAPRSPSNRKGLHYETLYSTSFHVLVHLILRDGNFDQSIHDPYVTLL